MTLQSAYYLLSEKSYRAYVRITVAYFLWTFIFLFGYLSLHQIVTENREVALLIGGLGLLVWLALWLIIGRRYFTRLLQQEKDLVFFSWDFTPRKEEYRVGWAPLVVILFAGNASQGIEFFALFCVFPLFCIVYALNTPTSLSAIRREGFVYGNKFYKWGYAKVYAWKKVGEYDILTLRIEKTDNLRPVSHQDLRFTIPAEKKDVIQAVLDENEGISRMPTDTEAVHRRTSAYSLLSPRDRRTIKQATVLLFLPVLLYGSILLLLNKSLSSAFLSPQFVWPSVLWVFAVSAIQEYLSSVILKHDPSTLICYNKRMRTNPTPLLLIWVALAPFMILNINARITIFVLLVFASVLFIFSNYTVHALRRDGFYHDGKLYDWGSVESAHWLDWKGDFRLALFLHKSDCLMATAEDAFEFTIPAGKKGEVHRLLAEVGVETAIMNS